MYYKLRLVNYYDVWGDAKTGWEINDALILCDNIWTSKLDSKTLLNILKSIGFIQKNVRTNQLNFDWLGPDYCEISIRHNEYPLARIDIIDYKYNNEED